MRDYFEKADNLADLKYRKIAKQVFNLDLAKSLLAKENKYLKIKRLSGRVWKLTEDYFENIELLLNAGLLEGLPAKQLARELRRFLDNPNSFTVSELDAYLRKGLIDKRTYNQLVKKISHYKPGKGIYRSARKNAERLARTEINRAFGYGDYLRRQKLDFVVGIEVKLSEAHPRQDICDDLAGKYPKDFIFTGWHPNCLCYSVSIVVPKQQYFKYLETGEKTWSDIDSPHAGFYKLLKSDEKGKLKKLYWYEENKKYVKAKKPENKQLSPAEHVKAITHDIRDLAVSLLKREVFDFNIVKDNAGNFILKTSEKTYNVNKILSHLQAMADQWRATGATKVVLKADYFFKRFLQNEILSKVNDLFQEFIELHYVGYFSLHEESDFGNPWKDKRWLHKFNLFFDKIDDKFIYEKFKEYYSVKH